MEVTEGKQIEIRFVCRRADGTPYNVAESDTIRFIVGQGDMPPSLERGVMGMTTAELRVIRVPMVEIGASLRKGATAKTGYPAAGPANRRFQYSFAPGERGDVVISPSPTPQRMEKGAITPAERTDEDLFFEVELISIENTVP